MSLNRIINIRALIGSDRIRIPTPEKNNPTRPWTGWDTETKIRKTKNRFEKSLIWSQLEITFLKFRIIFSINQINLLKNPTMPKLLLFAKSADLAIVFDGR